MSFCGIGRMSSPALYGLLTGLCGYSPVEATSLLRLHEWWKGGTGQECEQLWTGSLEKWIMAGYKYATNRQEM
jgi:hypothetical protein